MSPTTPTPREILDLDAILDRAGEDRVLDDIRDLVAEVRRLRETARRAAHMENVLARIPADVLEQATKEHQTMSDQELFRREVPGADEPVTVTAYTPGRYTKYVTLWAGTPDVGPGLYPGDYTITNLPAEVEAADYPAFRAALLAALDEAARAAGWEPPKAPELGTGELGGWKPEVIRVVDALRELDWTGFDPASLDDLAEVAAAVLNETDATFGPMQPLLPPPTE